MNTENLIKLIEKISPPELQEEWDHCGWQIKNNQDDIGRVLVALEVTDAVIREAEQEDVDLILTHHPFLKNPVREINFEQFKGRMIQRLIRDDISVYSTHTSFDKVKGGMNEYLGEVLGLENIAIWDEAMFLRTGEFPEAVKVADLVVDAAERLGISTSDIRVTGDLEKTVKTAAWCTGGGAGFLGDAEKTGCDIYITGDMKYHDAQDAISMGMTVIDAGHYGTEKLFVPNMAAKLENEIDIFLDEADNENTCSILKSMIDINPFMC